MTKRLVRISTLAAIIFAIIFIGYDYIRSSEVERKSVIDEQILDDSNNAVIDDEGKDVKYGAGVGNMVYDYELIDINTGDIVKISDFRGKKVLMNFWASWCPPCKAEAPHLQEFHEEQDEVVILGINVQEAERSKDAELKFIDDYGLTFVNTYAPSELYHVFPIPSFPTSILINSEGVIEEGIVGALDIETLRERFSLIK